MTEDPLQGADIGERRTVTESKKLHSINYTPRVFFGSDRDAGDIEVTDVEVIETDDMSAGPDIRITWESDVMKVLPPRWDQHDEPVTKTEEKQAKHKTWVKRAINAMSFLAPIGIALAIMKPMMNSLQTVTINGEPMGPVTYTEMLPAVVLVFLLAGVIYIGLAKGGFPGKVNTR